MANTIVTGVIGSDAHIIGNWILRYTLSQAGFKVIGLGTCVSQQEFIEAAIESKADAILVSSLYGMGILDCEGFRDRCREAGIGDILLYIGGKLVTDEQDWKTTESRFIEMGFNRAYPPDAKLDAMIVDLKKDLEFSDKPKKKGRSK